VISHVRTSYWARFCHVIIRFKQRLSIIGM
jgi:hypothetical protein